MPRRNRRNQQILKKLQAAEAEEISDDDEVCVADSDVQICEPPESAKQGAPLTLVLRTQRNKQIEVETTTVRVWERSAPQRRDSQKLMTGRVIRQSLASPLPLLVTLCHVRGEPSALFSSTANERLCGRVVWGAWS